MSKEELELKVLEADIEIKHQQAELLKAQVRKTNAETVRLEAV